MLVRTRTGHTLAELLIVIMILGILATVAVPCVLDVSGEASETTLRHHLATIRGAIETYSKRNGGQLPGQTDLEMDLNEYLGGALPESPVGIQNGYVTYATGQEGLRGRAEENTGWKYNNDTGEIICNHPDWDTF